MPDGQVKLATWPSWPLANVRMSCGCTLVLTYRLKSVPLKPILLPPPESAPAMTQPARIAAPPHAPFGYWVPPATAAPPDSPAEFRAALAELRAPVAVVRTERGYALARGGFIGIGVASTREARPVVAYLPPLTPAQLGDPDFLRDHRLKYAYMTGAMANGIGSVEVVG